MQYGQAIDLIAEMLLGQLNAAAKRGGSMHEVVCMTLRQAYQAGWDESQPESGPETIVPAAPSIEAWVLLTEFGHEFFLQRSAAIERATALSGSNPIPPLYHLTTNPKERSGVLQSEVDRLRATLANMTQERNAAVEALATIAGVNGYDPRESFPRAISTHNPFRPTVEEVGKLRDRVLRAEAELAGEVSTEHQGGKPQ